MSDILFEGGVPTFALDMVRERVAKVNKRAIKRGFPQVALQLGDAQMISDPYFEHKCNGGFAPISACPEQPRQVEYTSVAIAATGRLAMGGWRLVGVIAADAVDKAGNAVPMITNVPGESGNLPFITDAQLCEHCNTRRYRTETFALMHDDMRVMQVGRQCLRDFLGHDPAAILAGLDAFRELVISDDERESWGRSAPSTWTIDDVIMAASRIVATDGWYISRAKAEQAEDQGERLASTSSRVMTVLEPWNKEMREMVAEKYPQNATAERIAANTRDALANLKPNNDWEYKLAEYQNIAQVGSRHLGILASATILGLRLEERKAKAAARPESAHQGVVGQKLTLSATVMFTRFFDNAYGGTTLVKFSTEGGDVQWWQSGVHEDEWTIGQTVTLSGSVKAHDLDKFDQRPITTMTRCKVVTA